MKRTSEQIVPLYVCYPKRKIIMNTFEIFEIQISNQNEIVEYYKSFVGDNFQCGISELNKFNMRILFIMSSSILIDSNWFSNLEKEVHIFTSKLSEAWFTFESLIPIIENNNYKKVQPKPPKLMPKSVSSVGEALTIPKNRCEDTPAFGKPDFFEVSKISDGYLEHLLELEINNFVQYIECISNIKDDALNLIQNYVLYLEENSMVTQKKFLLDAYNALTNKSGIEPKHVLAISYSIRNQYVHDGEVIHSGIEDIEIKVELLKACYNFVINYSLIIAAQIAIENN